MAENCQKGQLSGIIMTTANVMPITQENVQLSCEINTPFYTMSWELPQPRKEQRPGNWFYIALIIQKEVGGGCKCVHY